MSATHRKVRVKLVAAYQMSSVGSVSVGGLVTPATLQVAGPSGSTSYTPQMQVTTVDSTNDYFVANGSIDLMVTISDLPQHVTYSGCCRLSTLMGGNANTPFQLQMSVPSNIFGPAPVTRSPSTSILPRVFATQGQPLMFQIPAQAYDGNTNTFQFVDPGVSQLVNPVPSANPANQLTLSNTGIVSWTPAAAGLYAVQMQINSQGVDNVVRTSAPVEFIIQVQPPCMTCATVTVQSPSTLTTAIGVDTTAIVTVTTTSTNPSSEAELQHTLLAKGMHVRKLTSGKTATWQVSWTPRPGQLGAMACFQGYDSYTGTVSVGTSCTQWYIQSASPMTLTGMLRTFSASHPDMNRPLNEATSANFVANTLGVDLKPVQTSPAPGVTQFNQWFNDVPAVNQTSIYSTWLSNAFQMDPGVFGFQSADWQPAEGQQFFTYEAHGSFVYQPGTMLSFKSAGDMWVYINRQLIPGANLHGVHASKTLNVVLDGLGLTPAGSYPIDIFYAHRGATTIPSIQLQLPTEAPVPSIGPVVVMDIPLGGFTPSDVTALGGATVTAGQLRLVDQQNSAGAGWLSDDAELTNGFVLDFSFAGTQAQINSGEGFAAIVAPSPGLGTIGSGLGYDSVPASVAVEFDAKQSPGSGDPAYQHIAMHTRGMAPNSFVEASPLDMQQPPDPLLLNTFFNATAQRVRVEYRPVTEQPIGWLRVWMNDNLLPALESLIDRASLDTLFGGSDRGMVGLTASTGSNASAVHIGSLRLTTFPKYNHPPFFPGGTVITAEGQPVDARFLVEDHERATITATMTGLPAGLSFSYVTSTDNSGPEAELRISGTMPAGSAGLYYPTLTLSDGFNVTHPTIVIRVDGAPRTTAPIQNVQISEEGVTNAVIFADHFADPLQQELQFVVESDQEWLVAELLFHPDSVRFRPTAEANGIATVTIRATDTDGQSVQQTFTVTVLAVNDPPTLNAIAPVTVTSGTTVNVALSNVTPGPVNEAGQAIEVVVVSSDPAATGAISYANGSLTLSPPLSTTTVTATVTVTVREVADPSSTVSQTFAVTITGVEPPPPQDGLEGRMHGQVELSSAGVEYDVHFRIAERQLGNERGAVTMKVTTPKSGKNKASANKFESTRIDDIVFSDDPAFTSGKAKKAPLVDTAVFTGLGKWNGESGYRFEAQATDQGEPGPGRDRFRITIFKGATVIASVDGAIAKGNVQSDRLKQYRK